MTKLKLLLQFLLRARGALQRLRAWLARSAKCEVRTSLRALRASAVEELSPSAVAPSLTSAERKAALQSALGAALLHTARAYRLTLDLPNDQWSHITARLDTAERELKLALAYLSNLEPK